MSPEKIRVMIADDHAVVRDMLAGYINAQADMEVVAEAPDGCVAVDLAMRHHPDVLLVDLSMPRCDGVEVIRQLHEKAPAVRALALTMHEEAGFFRAVLQAGGAGYVTKSAAASEVLDAVREVAHGRMYLRASLGEGPPLATLLDAEPDAASAAGDDEEPTSLATLSDRERLVLRLVAQGLTSREIASELHVSRSTVDTYRLRISEKIGVKGRAALVRYAFDTGLARDG